MGSKEAEKSLLDAAAKGDVNEIEFLHGQGLDLNGTDLSGKALRLAVLGARKRGGGIEADRTALVNVLLRLGARVEGYDDGHGLKTPLLIAAEIGATDILNALLDTGADPSVQWHGQTALLIAAQKGNLDSVILLLSLEDIFDETARSKALRYISWSWPSNSPRAPLIEALCRAGVAQDALEFGMPGLPSSGFRAYDDNGCDILDPVPDEDIAKSIQTFLDVGVDPNVLDQKSGETALHKLAWCAEGGKALSVLLEGGADPDLRGSKGKSNDKTPIQIASHIGNLTSVSLLLQSGADVTAQDASENTLLHEAAKKGNSKLYSLLADAFTSKVSPAVSQKETPSSSLPRNINGETPLHLAAGTGNLEIIRYLHETGANIDDATTAGWTPLLYSFARHGGVEWCEVTSYLLNHGADPKARCAGDWTSLHIVSLLSATIPAPYLANHDADFTLLVEKGADVNARATSSTPQSRLCIGQYQAEYLERMESTAPETLVSNETPLHWAASASNRHHIRLLLSQGADIEAQDSTGATPLIRAIKDMANDAVCAKAVTELLRQGASELRADHLGLNARDWSSKKKFQFDWERRNVPESPLEN